MTDTMHSQPQPAQLQYTDDSLAAAIITHIAAQKDVEPTTLDPLYEVIDPEALENLFAPQLDGTS